MQPGNGETRNVLLVMKETVLGSESAFVPLGLKTGKYAKALTAAIPAGASDLLSQDTRVPARLNRNVASAQGRTDFVRVRLVRGADGIWAEPILGKSGLLNTMVKADGVIEIGKNVEGLDKGAEVEVMLFSGS